MFLRENTFIFFVINLLNCFVIALVHHAKPPPQTSKKKVILLDRRIEF